MEKNHSSSYLCWRWTIFTYLRSNMYDMYNDIKFLGFYNFWNSLLKTRYMKCSFSPTVFHQIVANTCLNAYFTFCLQILKKAIMFTFYTIKLLPIDVTLTAYYPIHYQYFSDFCRYGSYWDWSNTHFKLALITKHPRHIGAHAGETRERNRTSDRDGC